MKPETCDSNIFFMLFNNHMLFAHSFDSTANLAKFCANWAAVFYVISCCFDFVTSYVRAN